METRGRKPLYSKPADLRKAIAEYFEDCEKSGVIPEPAGMRVALKLRKSDVERLCDDDAPYGKECKDIFEEANDRLRSYLYRKMVNDQGKSQGCMNMLNLLDKKEDGEQVLKVKVYDIKGGMEAFK